SDIAIKLAKAINGVIINADSRQIYKEMSIGTARPSDEQMQQVPHFLYGTVSVKDSYNIYEYQKDIFKLLETIPEAQTPILVGGTGLYIDSVIYNYNLKSQSEMDIDNERRNKLAKLSIEELQQQIPKDILEKLNNSDRNNPRRLQRIIERGSISTDNQVKKEAFPCKYFVIDLPSDILKTRIEKRVDEMIKNGLVEENKKLRETGLNKYPACNSIGYSEFDGYFENEKTIGDVKNEIVTNTLHYIKRQRTWFKRNQNAIRTTEFDLILKESENLLKYS
ncbi:tRNA (adenosine(37)-N6)-dimethylallyltransferase MiaA, partial [Patescibacteria group bacterium]|nr:tRNA (adenosine(37)-N6)-dimethylallyltransferase MiaA [Patescibacteria group bacterium]